MEFNLTTSAREYFYNISQIPHGSKNEKAISDYVVHFANEHGLNYVQDEIGNVVIYKKATLGYENCAPLALHGHLDMVCEKNNDSNHDFEKDPLQLYVDADNWLHATGTTLGADDGVAIAYMLAVLADDSLEHPALECIFTVQEEIGLIGASALDKNLIHSKTLISMDGGGEVACEVSSAGGFRLNLERELVKVDNNKPTYQISVTGLIGGHSGGEIHLERGNSNKLMARILKEMFLDGLHFQLVDIRGGSKMNAIPRECVVSISSDYEKTELEASVNKAAGKIADELSESDPGFKVLFEQIETSNKAFCHKCTKKVVDLLYLLPNGFKSKSMVLKNLTVASLNLGVVYIKDNKLMIEYCIRSAVNSATDDMFNQIVTIADIYDAEVIAGERYSGWKYNPNSKIRDIYKQVVKELENKEVIEFASHGGLECSIFADLNGGLDILEIGPIASGCHSPQEKLDLDSFDRTYHLLVETIKRCR